MKSSLGFTLLQTLTVLAISSATYLVALPAYNQLHQNHKATQTINSLLAQLQFARTTALGRGRYLSVCGLGDNDCDDDWSRGTLVFEDPDWDGVLADAEDIVRMFPRPVDNATITVNGSSQLKYINFTPTGTSLQKNNNGNIVYCSEPGSLEHARVLIFYRTGRAYLGKDENGNGIPENGSDEDITC